MLTILAMMSCTCTYTCTAMVRVPYYGITCYLLIHFNSQDFTEVDSLLNLCQIKFLEPTSAKQSQVRFMLNETTGGPGFLLGVCVYQNRCYCCSCSCCWSMMVFFELLREMTLLFINPRSIVVVHLQGLSRKQIGGQGGYCKLLMR